MVRNGRPHETSKRSPAYVGVTYRCRKRSAGASANDMSVSWQAVFGWTTQKFPFSVKTAHALKMRELHVITVTGKAFYDIGHAPADHSNRRSTPKGYAVWEIHPVMKMEVDSMKYRG